MTPCARRLKLGDCTNSSLSFNFACPGGDDFLIDLGVGDVTDPNALKQPEYLGTLAIEEGQQRILLLGFNSDENHQSSWLRQEERIWGYALTLPQKEGQPALASILKRGTHYKVVVNFSNAPPAGTSLWLSWHQNLLGF
jgi:hypothetical protein